MKDDIIVVVAVVETVSEKDEQGSNGISSRSSTRAYNEGWDRIFGNKNAKEPCKEDLN
jgi:hypothetical protein